MEGIEEQEAGAAGNSESAARSTGEADLLRTELAEFDRPLGAPRPANDSEAHVCFFMFRLIVTSFVLLSLVLNAAILHRS